MAVSYNLPLEYVHIATEINFIVHPQVEGATGIVMNERIDIRVMDGKRIEIEP